MTLRIGLAFALSVAALTGCRTPPAPDSSVALTSASATAGEGVAVVELFTSEGCSSCPSADAVLGELAKTHDPRVFPLAFHVDYWNSLGWPDRFSSAEWTDRQRQYAGTFGTGSVYTPQMIVGGVDQFTGSDRSHAASSIAHFLQAGAAARLVVTAEATSARDVTVRYHVESVPEGASLHVAIAERGLVTRVMAGENRGRTLPHENVVRAFATRPIDEADGVMSLVVPAEVDRSHSDVIGYVQASPRAGQAGMPVLAAARTGAPSPK